MNLSSNEAELALRHVVVGRKNFLGSQTINGADAAAALYAVMETAKKNSTDTPPSTSAISSPSAGSSASR